MIRKLIAVTIGVLVAAYFISGVQIDGVLSAIIFGLVFIVLNVTLKPILKFFTFPITILTLGLFLIVINIFVVYVADAIVTGISIENWWSALLFSIIVSIITSILEGDGKGKRDEN